MLLFDCIVEISDRTILLLQLLSIYELVFSDIQILMGFVSKVVSYIKKDYFSWEVNPYMVNSLGVNP